MSSFDDLSEDQKADVMNLVILTVKEIRQQIAADILATIPLWESKGMLKSRRTRKAFEASAQIAMGENEKF